MRYVLLALIALGLMACAPNKEYEDYSAAAEYLDGKIVRDKDGCAYMVTYHPNIYATLRWVADASAPTCSNTEAEPN